MRFDLTLRLPSVSIGRVALSTETRVPRFPGNALPRVDEPSSATWEFSG